MSAPRQNSVPVFGQKDGEKQTIPMNCRNVDLYTSSNEGKKIVKFSDLNTSSRFPPLLSFSRRHQNNFTYFSNCAFCVGIFINNSKSRDFLFVIRFLFVHFCSLILLFTRLSFSCHFFLSSFLSFRPLFYSSHHLILHLRTHCTREYN